MAFVLTSPPVAGSRIDARIATVLSLTPMGAET
jgi:hypothetical protein